MHRGHDHEHDHHHHNGSGSAGNGHNHRAVPSSVQWQTPHAPAQTMPDHREPDLDLVEMAFVEGFVRASDPASFLRLARIPFEANDVAGTRLVLLRVESDAITDVGALMPHLGGGTMRYDPLPARMVTHRRRLRFVYFDGSLASVLSLAEVRELTSL